MTPKEKAEEIYEKYKNVAASFGSVAYWHKNTKICALICIDEIIQQWEYINTYIADGGGKLNPNLKYWYEVKACLVNY